MKQLLETVRRFARGLCTNRVGTAGVVCTTTSFVLFSLAEVLRLAGVLTNAYVGLITYMALPALFVLGLLLIPVGWWLYRRRRGKTTRELLAERFDPELVAPRQAGSRVVRIIAVLTLANVIFLGAGSARMLQFMDQPRFCGTACHRVMGPEWAAYQSSPHARVKCVDCHVGTGAEAAFDAKLNGLWQMISVTFDLYPRPIPTPVHNLRPARETCERCHWPEAFYGDRIKRFVSHKNDRASTPRYTTLSLKVGSGKGHRRGEIHWHVAARNEVRYVATDAARSTIKWVEVKQPDGSYKRYRNRELPASKAPAHGAQASSAHGGEIVRTLDCVDCHNRATHIFEDPQKAVDARVASGEIDRRLPFARRRALAALTGSFRKGTELAAIKSDFLGSYRQRDPRSLQTHARQLELAVGALQKIWRRNIFPTMKIRWNTYANHLGHRNGPGCRRCHGPQMVDDRGRAVAHECTLCHSILAYDSPRPMEFLMPRPADERQAPMGDYLRGEFFGTTGKKGVPEK